MKALLIEFLKPNAPSGVSPTGTTDPCPSFSPLPSFGIPPSPFFVSRLYLAICRSCHLFSPAHCGRLLRASSVANIPLGQLGELPFKPSETSLAPGGRRQLDKGAIVVAIALLELLCTLSYFLASRRITRQNCQHASNMLRLKLVILLRSEWVKNSQ